MTIVVVGWHKRAISVRSDPHVTADAETVGEFEEFDLILERNGTFGLRTASGRFLSARRAGHVEAVADKLLDWERFRLVRAAAGCVGILTFHQYFLSAQPNGKLEANRAWLRDWEQFYIHRMPSADAFSVASSRLGSESAHAPALSSSIYDHCQRNVAACEAVTAELVGSVFFDNPHPASEPT
jgi:hypothetical protein